jgi:hypothetical protein
LTNLREGLADARDTGKLVRDAKDAASQVGWNSSRYWPAFGQFFLGIIIF